VDPFGKKGETNTVLAVWVEVENTGKMPRDLRWWQTPLEEHATLRTNLDIPVGRARLGPGTKVPDLGESRRPLPPGGPPEAALLLFQIPQDDVLFLDLRLDGSRVGESQSSVQFRIPPKAWK
jgi:hypothetical protein